VTSYSSRGKPPKSWIVRGRAVAVTAVPGWHQCAETTRIARGRGTERPIALQASVYRLVSIAFMGLPWPKKIAGSAMAPAWHVPAEHAYNRGTLRAALAVPALFAVAAAAWAAPPLPPRPTKYATDHTRTFDAARLSALNERLAAFERETSTQLIVYVDRKVPAGTTLEDMSSAAMRAWGVGQQGKRNGVALFVFVDDRKMRIEVGYGLEGALPDAAAHRITDGVIKPHFKKGDYASGVEAGVNAILSAVRAEGNKGTGATAAEKASGARPAAAAAPLPPTRLGWLCPLVTLSPLALWPLLRSFLRAMAWGSLGAGAFAFVMALVLWDGLWFFGAMALLVVSLVFWIVLWVKRHAGSWTSSAATSGSTSTWSDSGSSWSSGSSGSSWSSSDSGSSSSDFSGGGGDSGGGGSSDSW
jgi:uncharacterized protein